MQAPEDKPLAEYLTETIADARQFQKEHPENPMVNAVLDHLIGQVEAAFRNQYFQTVSDRLRNIKEVMAGPEPRERVSGRVQIVDVATWEEAKELCPWACRFQPVGDQEHQKGKWICFETDDDADFYRGL